MDRLADGQTAALNVSLYRRSITVMRVAVIMVWMIKE